VPGRSGKSTLIRTINRLEPIQSGKIHIDGQDVHHRGLEVNGFRSRIGFLFQQFNLFPHLSVIANCTLAPKALKGLTPAQAREQALGLLDRVGLAHKADAYPAELSGGQQQRVAIARALAMERARAPTQSGPSDFQPGYCNPELRSKWESQRMRSRA
jgi:polar amino acid transport system ATP-binding protein